MRIAIDSRLVGYTAGIAQYATQLSRALACLDDGDERYLLIRGRRAAEPLVRAPRVHDVRAVTPPHHPLERWALPVEILARVGAPALVHSVDHVAPAWGPWRSVVTIHDLAFLRFPETHSPCSRAYYAATAASARRADRVIAVSHSTARDVRALLDVDPGRLRVVHEAAGPQFYPRPRGELEALADRLRLDASRRYLLFVGTIEARKNVVLLLEAFALVVQDLDVDLVVVGSPGYGAEEVFETRARLGLGARAHFPGPLGAADLAALYSHAEVFAFPSRYEGFGLILLEAMACGAPVVSSSAGPMPEVVGEAAILLPPEEPSAWAEALARVLSQPALAAELRARGFARAAEFSWERAARETRAVYREAVECEP